MIPQKLKVLGLDYEVKLIEGDEAHYFGTHDGNTQIIRLNANKHKDQVASTLLHEIIEAINMHLDLGLSHPQISALEIGLYQVLKENRLSFCE